MFAIQAKKKKKRSKAPKEKKKNVTNHNVDNNLLNESNSTTECGDHDTGGTSIHDATSPIVSKSTKGSKTKNGPTMKAMAALSVDEDNGIQILSDSGSVFCPFNFPFIART